MTIQKAMILNELFDIEVAFYKLEVSKRMHTCCSVRKIYRKGFRVEGADALIILPNPRSCVPVDKHALYELNPPSIGDLRMQKSKAHQTEYQLMCLMDRMDWKLVFIVHLTDLQSKDVTDLAHDLHYMKSNEYNRHSIFTPERIIEVNRFIGRETKVIAGWGLQKDLRSQAVNALTILTDKRTIYGLPHTIVPYYYHPYSFTKINRLKWLDKIELQLRTRVSI